MRSRRGPPPERRLRLTRSERKQLRRWVRRYSLPYRQVMRAKLILQLNVDPSVGEAAFVLNVDEKTVRRWRDRFLQEGRIKALCDRLRAGRPVEIDAVSRCQVIAMACGEPSDFGEKFRDVWTIDSLFARFCELHPKKQMSRTSVLRILNQEGIRPHRVKMWLHSPDPEFREV